MLLTIDVGNTQTVLGLYEDGASRSSAEAGLVDHWRIGTDHERTSDEHAVLVRSLLRQSGHGLESAVPGVARKSVVYGTRLDLGGRRHM